MFKITATLEIGTQTRTEITEGLSPEQVEHLRQDYRETTPRGATTTVKVEKM